MTQTIGTFQPGGHARSALRYLLFLPARHGAHERQRWPLLLFLHGASERGSDPHVLKRTGLPQLVEEQPDFPFVVISPQCPARAEWERYQGVLPALLDEIVARYSVDEARQYLTGISMGGAGAWHLGARYPTRFAAIVPICGYGLRSEGFPRKVCALKHVPIWTFHGARDPSVPLGATQLIVDTLRGCGGSVRFTIYPEAGHDAWSTAYADPELYAWLLRQSRAPAAQ